MFTVINLNGLTFPKHASIVISWRHPATFRPTYFHTSESISLPALRHVVFSVSYYKGELDHAAATYNNIVNLIEVNSGVNVEVEIAVMDAN